jgi:hypothetical protein
MNEVNETWTRRRFLSVLGGTAVVLPNIITSRALGANRANAGR